MALTVHQQPDAYSPARSPCVFVLSSTNVNRTGFGFVGHLFDASGDLICELDIPKRPSGKGIIDVSSVLRSFIDHEADVRPGATSFSAANSFFKSYSISFGEKAAEFEFLDSYYGPSGRVAFTGLNAHNFIVGQQVLIRQTNPFYSEFDGVHVVMDVVDDYAFSIDVGFQSGPTTPGVAMHADGSAIIESGITSVSALTVYGSSFSREDFTQYDQDEWIPDASNLGCGILCNAPDGFRLGMESQMWIPIPNNGHNRCLRITTKDANDATVGVYVIQSAYSLLSHPTTKFLYCGVGPYNIETAPSHFTLTGSTSPIFGASVTHYLVGWMDDTSDAGDAAINTTDLRLDIDDRCAPYEEFRVLFCDKKGAWVPWTFPFKSTEEHAVKKATYFKGGYGEESGNAFVFRDQRRGYDVHNAEHLKSFVVRSDWMTDEESIYFMELISSPFAFWCKSATTFLPIIIDDQKTQRLKFGQEEELIRYELKFALAYQENNLV